tara:strand:+ start:3906 stop:4148 length:243 start_codon:yes stop_codon:yes gene_type:complete
MKITKSRLRQIIKEEIESISKENLAIDEYQGHDSERVERERDSAKELMDQWVAANPNAPPAEVMNAYHELMGQFQGGIRR